MKVLQINAVYGYYSTGVIVRDISEMLQSNNDVPYTLCIQANEISSNIILADNRPRQKLHALLTRMFGRQGFWSTFSTKKLLRSIRRIDPDIIHLHNLHSNFINLRLLLDYCSRHNKPVVVTLHDCWFFTGKCYHFEDVGCSRWLTGCGHCPKRLKDIPSLICDSSKSTYTLKKEAFSSITNLHVVGCSKWITSKASLSPIFSGAEFHTIHNGVDTAIFHPYNSTSSKGKSDKFEIIVMANKWFLPENKNLREELPLLLDNDCVINIIGCNKNQLNSNKSSDRMRYYGYISRREELAVHFRAADVFLNVTFIDTLPTVNMEAICCGTPVITYKSGGSPELINEGETGFVVEQNDIEGVVTRINSIKSEVLDRMTCAKVGLLRFDKNSCYKDYINLYNQILSE